MSQTPYRPTCFLDGQPVEKITAFLFPKGGNDNPYQLKANEKKSFQGSIVLGMGFTFDDTSDEATPIAEMERLIAENPHYQEVIFPYIGGSEVNSSPTHSHHRYVINFGEMPEDEAREKYPDLMAIVEQKVKPARLAQKREIRARYWWRFGETTPALFKALAPLSRVLVIARTSKSFAFTFLHSNYIFSENLVIFSFEESFSSFLVLQSSFHELWVRFFSSSLKDDLAYRPSDCFETFPFPEAWEDNSELEAIGQEYYEYRAELMVKNNQGLTDTYNRFHDPDERDPAILKLRELHQKMDEAVLKAYGWDDLTLECGFDLDYFDLEPESVPNNIQERIDSNDFFFSNPQEAAIFDSYVRAGSRKTLPWRHRWHQDLHDEILARLLELNATRYEEEQLLGKSAPSPTSKRTQRRSVSEGQGELFL